jgi:methionyl-tRNA synthetase
MVNYDDFAKLEIRIGTILTADFVEGSDRLLRLMVDVGEVEPRQIISGIREFFPEPEALVGKQCPFLINLEPRTIRGLESQGMILAAGTDESFTLLSPDQAIPAGAPIK